MKEGWITQRQCSKILCLVILFSVSGSPVRADDDDYNAAKLTRYFNPGNMPLDRAIKASEHAGETISAKYDISNGLVRLSVTVLGGEGFSDMIFDPQSGSITATQPVTDPDDLNDAQVHAKAITKANVSLVQAVEEALKANSGYQAVRVVPVLAAGVVPVAMVTLIRGNEIKDVFERLD